MAKMNYSKENMSRRRRGGGVPGPTRAPDVELLSWLEGRPETIQRKAMKSPLAAIEAAWQGRPAQINEAGVLRVVVGGSVMLYAVKAYGTQLTRATWVLLKAKCKPRRVA